MPRTQLIDISVPHSCHGGRYDSPRIYRLRDLRPSHWFQDGPYRVTTVERTVFDLSEVLDRRWLSALVFSALRQHQAFAQTIACLLIEQACGRRGASLLRSLLEKHSGAVPQSVPEVFLVDLVRATGLAPTLQYSVGRRQTVDLAWPAQRLIVEVDGWTTHSSFSAFTKDRARDRAAVRAGWATLRFTRDEIVADVKRVVAEIQEVLATRTAAMAETAAPRPSAA